jgi:hypothetical protein
MFLEISKVLVFRALAPVVITLAGDFSRSVIVIQQLVFCGIVLYLGFRKSAFLSTRLLDKLNVLNIAYLSQERKKNEFLIYNSAEDNMIKNPLALLSL